MLPWFQPEHVGNPGSIHTQGFNAFCAIDNARKQVAKMINAEPSEIFFTSCGTESNNTWMMCLDYRLIVTTKLEHHSVLEPIEKGFHLCHWQYARVHQDGSVDLNSLEKILADNRNTIDAISIMWVNNELGTINPMKEIGALCKKYGVMLHTDAVQAAGHIPIDVKECGIDFLSMSGHKFGAPLGIGVLYIANRIKKKPLILGGGQENGIRGGTQNVPGIVGIGKAAEIACEQLPNWQEKWTMLRKRFLDKLFTQTEFPIYINGGEKVTENIISLTFPDIESESLLLMLDKDGICVSAGSACSASNSGPSHVLTGIGFSDILAASTVRISMGVNTTAEEMDITADAIIKNIKRLNLMYQF